MDTTQWKPEARSTRLAQTSRLDQQRRLHIGARWAGVITLAFIVTSAGSVLALRLKPDHIAGLVLNLAVSGGVSLLLGATALWLADAPHIGGVRFKFALPSLLTAVVIAFMSVSSHGNVHFWQDGQILLAFLLRCRCRAVLRRRRRELTTAIGRIALAGVVSPTATTHRIAEHEVGTRRSSTPGRVVQLTPPTSSSLERQGTPRPTAGRSPPLSHDRARRQVSIRAMIEAIDDGVVTG